MPIRGGIQQRRLTILILHLEVSTRVKEQLNDGFVALLGDSRQRCLAVVYILHPDGGAPLFMYILH
jgi:hypothetical protein